MTHIHCIGIGGIGLSAVARYYHDRGHSVGGSDLSGSTLTDALVAEGISVHIGEDAAHVPPETTLVIYSEAIITKPDISKERNLLANPELAHAIGRGIPVRSYPEALAEIFDAHRGIAVCGSHGKSTTTAMLGVVLAGSRVGGSTIVGTQVPQFGGKNIHVEEGKNFVIEACEYKRSFLQYHPYITVVTNIDLDHLDYYHDLADYVSAFRALSEQTSGYIVLSGDDTNSQTLANPSQNQVWVYRDHYVRSDRP